MSKRLYVGNLAYSVTEDDLRSAFSSYGPVEDAAVIEGRGFGFVTLADENSQAAVDEMNGKELGGRTMIVNEARPRENRSGGGGFRSGGGGGGFRSGGGRGGSGGGRGRGRSDW